MVFEYRVKKFAQWLQDIQISRDGYMYILDHQGNVVAHPDLSAKSLHSEYADELAVLQARKGDFYTVEYTDPLEKESMIATFLPIAIGTNLWVVVAQQPSEVAFGEVDRVRVGIGIAGTALSLLTLVMIFALARMHARNKQLNIELQKKNRSLEDFSSIVSHQLKAPVTAIRWTLEGMLDGDHGDLPKELEHELRELYKVNKGNYQLIMDILNMSRLDRGVVELELEEISLMQIAERAIRDYRDVAEQQGLYIRLEGDGDVRVKADMEKAAESIANSVSNAMKHTKAGGITISISASDGMGQVEVSDTGSGMPKAILKNLFSRDGIHKSNTSAEGSSGLGLYIAKKFMQMQGGDVVADSEPGRGSTFTYTLPLA